MTKARQFRELLQNARPLVAPGVYDGYRVRLVESMGFATAAMTGSGPSNSRFVQPDIGILSLREMCKKIEAVTKARKDPDFVINARTDSIATGGIEDITDLMGYARIAELEQAFTLEEDVERLYGDGTRDYVVRGAAAKP